MSQEENNNQQNGQSKESKKIAAAHAKAMSQLVAVFNGEGNLDPVKKISADSVSELMEEVLQEEREGKKQAFKDGAKALIQKKMAYSNFIKQKEQEFQKIKDAKTKEFTAEANKLLGMVDDINGLSKRYYEALGADISDTDNLGTSDTTSEQ